MSYIALYRKYRPKIFDEIVGQDKNILTIKNAIVSGKISHAYLFCGSRGTGKTSTAKVIAKTVNCLNLQNGIPCEKCENCELINNNMCEDIVEIDAASNNGVDEIREIRDKVSLVPAKLKYKIYIIDEVHMLTTGAFNALLKTLEEPPRHVIFILATTESYKIPVTISSRCQKFSFEKITVDSIVNKLKDIVEIEKCVISDECLFAIAEASDGAMRDAIGLLDQLIIYCNGSITMDDVCNIAGIVSQKQIVNFLEKLLMHEDKEIIKIIDDISKSGKSIVKFIEKVMCVLKEVLLCKRFCESNKAYDKILDIVNESKINIMIFEFNKLSCDIRLSSNQLLMLEVCALQLMDRIGKGKSSRMEGLSEVDFNSVQQNELVEKLKINNTKAKNTDVLLSLPVENIKKRRINNAFALADKKILNDLKGKWYLLESFLINKKYKVIAGLLLDSVVVVAGEKNMIVTNSVVSTTSRINGFLDIATELCFNAFGVKYDLIALSNEEWKTEKQIYMNNRKNNVEYKYVLEKDLNVKKENVFHNGVSELIDMFGTDIIEYK